MCLAACANTWPLPYHSNQISKSKTRTPEHCRKKTMQLLYIRRSDSQAASMMTSKGWSCWPSLLSMIASIALSPWLRNSACCFWAKYSWALDFISLKDRGDAFGNGSEDATVEVGLVRLLTTSSHQVTAKRHVPCECGRSMSILKGAYSNIQAHKIRIRKLMANVELQIKLN